MAAIEDGIPLQHALGKAVRASGVKEFAAKIGMESPNLLRAINPRHNPTQATINRILSPFGLRLSLAPIKKQSGVVQLDSDREITSRLKPLLFSYYTRHYTRRAVFGAQQR